MKPWKSWPRLIAAGGLVLVAGLVAVLVWSGKFQDKPSQPTGAEAQGASAKRASPESSSEPGRFDREARYAGSRACAQCHAEIAEQFANHPMALSTRHVEDDPWLDSQAHLPAQVPGKQRVLKVDKQEQQLVHCEEMYDESDELIYEQCHRQDYVVGSGRRARAYVERRGTLLFMSPLNWYALSDRWGLAPGYQPDDVRRFDRRVNDDCLACHAGRIAVKVPGANIYQDPPFHETAIGCERCHGPAADHVAMHEQAGSAGPSDPIINPVKLEPDRRESVCYQCHLEAAARVLRPGRTHLDFRPGMQLSDVWAILDQGTDVTSGGRTRSVNHVQQMRDSVCFRQSQGKMGCISCHDPHRLPPAEEKAAFYRQRCVTCHSDRSCSLPLAQRQEKQDDCVACHMPSLNSKNMAHIAQTDHRVLRRPLEQADPPGGAGSRAVSLTYFGDAAERLPPAERQRGLLLGTYIHCKRKGIPIPSSLMLYLEEVLRLFPQDVAVLNTLGAVALERNDLPAARNYYEKAVEVDGKDENALDGLLGVSYAMADWPLCIECATRLLDIDPSNARVYALRGDALVHLERAREGIADIERAVELNPGVIPLREWLIEQYRQHGLKEKRDEQTRQLERIRNARIPEWIAEGQKP